MCIRVYILFKKTHKQKAKETKKEKRKTKETKEEKEKENSCCEQYLWKIWDTIILFANLLFVLLTYVIKL